MAPDSLSTADFRDQLLSIREKWHCKNHPFYIALHEGKLDLKVMGQMMAQHYHHVRRVLPSFALSYAKCPDEHVDAGKFFLENLAEEAGVMGLHGSEDAHDHMDLIMAFCAHVGLSRDDVVSAEPLPAWRARTSYYEIVAREEPTVIYLAMLACLEGQEVGINTERTIPGFTGPYGFAIDDPVIEFFTEHAEADAEHSRRQLEIVDKYVTTPELRASALYHAERSVKLRWASFNDLYRYGVLGEKDPLPPGVAA